MARNGAKSPSLTPGSGGGGPQRTLHAGIHQHLAAEALTADPPATGNGHHQQGAHGQEGLPGDIQGQPLHPGPQEAVAVEAAALTVGRENVEANTSPLAGAEDFAFMLEKKPGAYIMIGNGGAGEGGCQNVHSPLYDFNDQILTTGAAYWMNLVQLELGDAA